MVDGTVLVLVGEHPEDEGDHSGRRELLAQVQVAAQPYARLTRIPRRPLRCRRCHRSASSCWKAGAPEVSVRSTSVLANSKCGGQRGHRPG
jgi:hypothetical protein